MSEEEILRNNPAEPVPDVSTAAESGQPVEPDEEPQQALSEDLGSYQAAIRQSVRFAESSNAEKDEDTNVVILDEITKALSFFEASNTAVIPFEETLRNANPVIKNYSDKYTQTFFKYMKNLSDRRFMEIIKQEVDHSDESLIFYCSENNLPFTFQL